MNLKKLQEFFKKFFAEYLLNMLKFLRKKAKKLPNEIKELFVHFNHLKERNIDLLFFHISKGNYRDASLRIWILQKFISKNDLQIEYFKAIVKFLKGDIDKSIPLFKKTHPEFTSNELLNYVENYQSTEFIPINIYNFIFKLTIDQYIVKYIGKKYNLISDFLNILDPHLPALSRAEDYKVLDFGPNIILSKLLKSNLPKSSFIDGYDFLSTRYQFSNSFEVDIKDVFRRFEYDNNIDGIKCQEKKYDLIISFDSLSFTKNLREKFKFFKSKLSPDGILALLIPISEKTALYPHQNTFKYSEEDIKEKLSLAEFKIKTIKETISNKNQKYLIILAI